MNLRPFDVFVRDIAPVPVVPECVWSDGSHQICVDKLEGELDLVIGRLGVSQLMAFAHGANVAVWHGTIEAYSVVVSLFSAYQDSCE